MTQEIIQASSGIKELYKLAILVREHAYSPYSGYKVGAAIRLTDGKIFTGCNVENASFGATVCAERVAILKAISECSKIEIKEVMVVTNSAPPWPPCGMCRQVIAEFGHDIIVYASNTDGQFQKFPFHEIFPQAFTSSNLNK
jgi:cytidine deaminase